MLAWPQQAEDTGQAGPLEFRSPGIEALVRRMQEPRRYHILDLGPALAANVRFFSRFRCRLYIEDVLRAWEHGGGLSPAPPRFVSPLPTGSGAQRLDLILAWDLFSYLERDAVTALMSALVPACARGTWLFMVASTLPAIPARPAACRILDEQRLRLDADFTSTRPNPGLTPKSLERMMPRFQLLHAFLSRSGLQEYLFSFE